MALSEAQKKYLRGLGHHLKPVLMIADSGLSESVASEFEIAITHHELIKVKIKADRVDRQKLSQQISKLCHAELIQSIGQVSCFYRPNPDKAVITLPSS